MAQKVIVVCDHHPDREAVSSWSVVETAGPRGERRVDLCDECDNVFRSYLPVRGGATKSARRPAAETEEIRSWAKENGIAISNRGRIPASVEAEFRAAVG